MWAFLCTFTPKYAYIMYKEIKTAETYHVPVLLDESVGGLNIKKGGIYVDVTFGGGGHSREILSRLDPTARLFSGRRKQYRRAGRQIHVRQKQLQIPQELDEILRH